MANKITKKQYYGILLNMVEKAKTTGTVYNVEVKGKDGEAFTHEVNCDELRDFISREVELLDAKAVAAQKRAAEKKKEGDALRELVYNTLSDTDFISLDEIVATINDPLVKRNMVVSRLAQLADLELIEKDKRSSENEGSKSRKIVVYRRKSVEDDC